MIYQPKLADIFAIDSVVATLKGNAVIPDVSMTIYRLMQFTIAVIRIQLELVKFLSETSFLAFISMTVECGRPYSCDRAVILPRKPRQVCHF